MSNTNYDVELNITYNNAYRHYIPTYKIAVPYFNTHDFMPHFDDQSIYYEAVVSFDSGSETDVTYGIRTHSWIIPTTVWNTDNQFPSSKPDIPDAGVFSKVYLRNPNRNKVTFNYSNCRVQPIYLAKAPFEVKINSSGYIASSNASFKCSTVEKNIPVQYSWTAARVYYKKTTDQSYSYVNGTVSGTWSDITVSTSLALPTGYSYNIYILAIAIEDRKSVV